MSNNFQVRQFVISEHGLAPHKANPAMDPVNLKPGIYDVLFRSTPDGTIFAVNPRREKKFLIPEHIFGINNPRSHISTVMKTRMREQGKIGIGLIGQKGSGKTLKAQYIANKLIEEKNAVCFYISSGVPEGALRILTGAAENVIIFIDEFDRRYCPSQNDGRMDQTDLLSFFSDTYSNNVTFILTANTPLNEYYINRPDRVRFMLHHRLLEDYILEEVLERHPIEPAAELYIRTMFGSYEPKESESIHGRSDAFEEVISSKMPLSGRYGSRIQTMPNVGDGIDRSIAFQASSPDTPIGLRYNALKDVLHTEQVDKFQYNMDSLLQAIQTFQDSASFGDAVMYLDALNIPHNPKFIIGSDPHDWKFMCAPCSGKLVDMLTGFVEETCSKDPGISYDGTGVVTYNGGPDFDIKLTAKRSDGKGEEYVRTIKVAIGAGNAPFANPSALEDSANPVEVYDIKRNHSNGKSNETNEKEPVGKASKKKERKKESV